MTKDERAARISSIKREANTEKSRLIRLYQEMSELSKVEANRLSAIIARLEAWQNSQP